MKIADFNLIIEKLLRVVVTETNVGFEYKLPSSYSSKEVIIHNTFDEYNELIINLPTKIGECQTYENTFFETLVELDNNYTPLFGGMGRVGGIENDYILYDDLNKITYTLGKPSNQYLLIFLSEYSKLLDDREFKRRSSMRMRMRLERALRTIEEPYNIFEILKVSIPELYTLRIESTNKKSLPMYEKLVHTFIFSLSYNLDYSIIPVKSIDELVKTLKYTNSRKVKAEDIPFPKKTYNNDLILFYQKGISSESVDHQFLSFYHIIEHFFKIIADGDMIDAVKSKITSSGFSYKDDKSIQELVKLINKNLIYKKEDRTEVEDKAFELTLKKFINSSTDIKDELDKIDSKLVPYYQTNKVVFASGNTIDFSTSDKNIFIKNVVQRIYSIRNSIVHSKESDKSKYLPFRDDKILAKEIYLIRVIAEKIIMASGEMI